MSEIFDRIVSGGYFVGFGGLTPEQEHCKEFTRQNLDALLHVRQREKFVKEIRVCCCGYGPADEEEPMEDNNFSQFQFYLPFTNDIIFFEDKFDFLVKCVANGVCKVEVGFEERYLQAVLDTLTFRDTTVPEVAQVLDLRSLATPRIVAEIPRTYEENVLLVESYVQKRNTYADKIRAELEMLEREQFNDEKRRGLHPSVMGWSNPSTPRQEGPGSSAAADKLDDDATIAKLKTQISLAREEAALSDAQKKDIEDQALVEAYVKNGGKLDDASSATPVMNLLLRLQEEQVRIEHLNKTDAIDNNKIEAL